MKTIKTFKIWIKSLPGFYAQYDGSLTVYAYDDDEAIEKAFDKLRRGAFPDRSRGMWKIEKIERIIE